MPVTAKRCTICDINFPRSAIRCFHCDGDLWELFQCDPDPDWEEKIERLKNPPIRDEKDRAASYRRAKFVEIGFTPQQARVLGDLQDSKGVFLYWADVKRRFLDKGADPHFVFDCLANTVERGAPREAHPDERPGASGDHLGDGIIADWDGAATG